MRKQFIVVSVLVLVVVFIGTITWAQQRATSSIPTHCEQIDTQTGDVWVSMGQDTNLTLAATAELRIVQTRGTRWPS